MQQSLKNANNVATKKLNKTEPFLNRCALMLKLMFANTASNHNQHR